MPKLQTVALPKSTAGRRAAPLDNEFAAALVTAVKASGNKPDKDGNRAFHTSDIRHDTKGKASADGRRYANHVQSELKLDKVSVRVYPDGNKFGWGLYLPVPEKEAAQDS